LLPTLRTGAKNSLMPFKIDPPFIPSSPNFRTWTRLKNDRHSAPVVVKGLIGRTAPWDPFGRIFFVVERTLLPGLKTVKLFKTHFKPGAQ
ncbi:MAG: hypothetical protein MJA30_03370, partial [Cytophagales bacterium]|nr:hypothetical protein [Cytophagales bacterium]